jgi:ArsR family transcriptional regulator, arsenate/arsenite/antimonite-responsive transcriptional repressor
LGVADESKIQFMPAVIEDTHVAHYTCTMTQVCKQSVTPKRASRRQAKIDRVLDPVVFKALADPKRARVLACLIKCGRACSVTEVAECCSVDFSMVARQLSALADAGVLEKQKEGRTMWYTARSGHLVKMFRDLADAIEEWTDEPCTDGECCDDQ